MYNKSAPQADIALGAKIAIPTIDIKILIAIFISAVFIHTYPPYFNLLNIIQ